MSSSVMRLKQSTEARNLFQVENAIPSRGLRCYSLSLASLGVSGPDVIELGIIAIGQRERGRERERER